MADSTYATKQKELKYLDFVHVAAVQAILCMASLYELAKEKAGPLKGGVQSAESTVKSIVDPVYKRFHGLPLDLLFLADRKVDSVVKVADQHVPAGIKTVICYAYTVLVGLTEALCEFLTNARNSGLSAALKTTGDRYEPVAVELYKEYEPVAEQYAVATWLYVNRLPFFPQVANLVIPTAAHWAEKYNRAVESASARGLPVVQYLPEIPIEKITKVFSGDRMERDSETATVPVTTSGESKSVAEPEAESASPKTQTEADSTEGAGDTA